jgi:phosphoribosylglycinamide formyltransferase 2
MTTIGTPGSKTATKVMLLGAGELGKEVVIALQRLGVEVIAVDRYKNAPGQQVAHRARVIDMTDASALRELITSEKPDIVVPEIEAIATKTLVELEHEGVTKVIPTARAAELTMNREGIRRLAAEELGLAIEDSNEPKIGYPCLVKPVMSSSGKGQSRLDSPADIAKAWNHAISGGRVDSSRVIVEGLVKFEYEITLLTVRARGSDGTVGTHFCEPIGHVQVSGDYVESWQPHPMSTKALEESRRIAGKVTDALGGTGIFGVELFVAADRVWFSEVSPRPHDTGLVTLTSQHQSEFDLHARAILGLPVDVTLRSPAASAVIYGGMEAEGIVFMGIDKALQVPGSDLRLFGKPASYRRRRMGVALARAADIGTARQNAKLAASRVKPRRG